MIQALKTELKSFISDAGKYIRDKGKDIYKKGGIIHFVKGKFLVFKVPDSSPAKSYNVEFDFFSYDIEAECPCPFDEYPCHHMVAAAYYILGKPDLMEVIAEQMDEYDEDDDWDPWGDYSDGFDKEKEIKNLKPVKAKPAPVKEERNTNLFTSLKTEPPDGWPLMKNDYIEFNLRMFNEWVIQNRMNIADRKKAYDLRSRKVRERQINERSFESDVSFGKNSDKVFLHISTGNQIFVSSLQRQKQVLPSNKDFLTLFEGAALIDMLSKKGFSFFQGFANYDKEKQEILNQYGLKITDPEAAAFEFRFNLGYTEIIKKPNNILPVDQVNVLEKVASELNLLKAGDRTIKAGMVSAPANTVEKPYEIAFLFNASLQGHCHFIFEPFMLTESSNKLEVKKIGFKNDSNFNLLKTLPADFLDEMEKITEQGLLRQLPSSFNFYSYSSSLNNLDDAGVQLLRLNYYQWFRANWDFLKTYPFLYQQLPGTKFNNKSIQPVKLADDPVTFSFEIKKDDRFIGLHATAKLPDGTFISLDECLIFGGFLLHYQDTLYLPKNKSAVEILKVFQNGSLKIHVSKAKEFMEKLVVPFTHKYELSLPDDLVHGQVTEEHPGCAVYLSELNTQFLLVKPVFKYGGLELDYEPSAETSLVREGEKFWQVQRNRKAEDTFMNWLREQHPAFLRQVSQPYMYLRFNDALKDRWFLNFYQHLHQQDIPVFGMNQLKQFRYNPHPPKFEMDTSSGVDWFDLRIDVTFGDQHVSLKELKKALASRQPYVLLGDGSIGMLPEDWIKKYGTLFSYGQENKEKGKEGSLRLSKLHFTLLEQLPIKDEQVLRELQEKKDKLKEVENVEAATIPKMTNVTLRPYQKSGFQWMNVLDQLGWGGCLADDMGLGKTLQVLTFLTALHKTSPKSTHLIVCPTSLLFNWEAEISKYAPELSYHVYYGAGRDFTEKHFNEYTLVLTSYGTLRNDIDHLMTFPFHYVILDESQTIKNPLALTTRATLLLQAKNRLVLSGTPLQNNTGDLYAQFNFLNPGMLGSYEQFKSQFGTPIDRNGDKEASVQLKRIIYPFLLRRTKEQVATDLPAKTETVLYMEMDKEQTRIYNAFKEHYRNSLLGRIEKEGVANSTIYILEGLTKLRQICNSPALLNEEEQYPNKSIKLEELSREVKENLGGHKGLVFSQFTGMLALIREMLEKEGIAYEYLDGSTPAAKRKEAVRNFQENESVKVFLISLKAGGVGLNLTAADYVYLVDPWWNPATEQQAIDRTHRIGQDKKIFAYKMICKNTVEEKILDLQKRKKALAAEIISEESGFIKKLTKEDVEWLFT